MDREKEAERIEEEGRNRRRMANLKLTEQELEDEREEYLRTLPHTD